MPSSTLLKPKFFIFPLIFMATFCFSGLAEDIGNEASQRVARALVCFNNKYIYDRCNEAYRLSESGEINVPTGRADVFCRGPCLVETQMVLNCVDTMFSSFLFNNRATVGGTRNAINLACAFSNRRGDFNLGGYWEGESSNAHRPQIYILRLILLLCILAFYSIFL